MKAESSKAPRKAPPPLAEVLAVLRRNEARLKALGVRHAAVFGSVARGTAGPGSDIDIAVELDPEKKVGLFELVGIKQELCRLLWHNVDVHTVRYYTSPRLRNELQDAAHAF